MRIKKHWRSIASYLTELNRDDSGSDPYRHVSHFFYVRIHFIFSSIVSPIFYSSEKIVLIQIQRSNFTLNLWSVFHFWYVESFVAPEIGTINSFNYMNFDKFAQFTYYHKWSRTINSHVFGIVIAYSKCELIKNHRAFLEISRVLPSQS